MLRSLQLLLPALLPSWGFFDYIQPSPRIQYQLLNNEQQPVTDWQEFRARPERISLAEMVRRLVWNPHWNETLFLMSCAERLMEHPTLHSETTILECIAHDWHERVLPMVEQASAVRFRLLFVRRQDRQLVQDIRFVSTLFTLPVRAA